MEVFQQTRPKLFGIAYRMLGSVAEAEDIVQEAYLRYRDAGAVQSPEPFLRKVVIRLCLDHLKSAQVQRESYVGPWLPAPVLTDPFDQASDHESISIAFMLLLERLSPEERAVFLLRDVFDYEYGEIAAIVGKSEDACRQIFSRARKHLTDNRPRFRASADTHRQMLGQFIQAVQIGELDGLKNLLSEAIELRSDGGGKASAATRILKGPERVAQFLIGLARRADPRDTGEIAILNGRESIVLRAPDGHVTSVLSFEIVDGLIHDVYILRNPDKMHHLAARPGTD